MLLAGDREEITICLILTVQGVEGVEKFFLGCSFPGDELDIVD